MVAKLALKNDSKTYSLENKTLVFLSNEEDIKKFGLAQNTEIQLNTPFTTKKYTASNEVVNADSKIFTLPIPSGGSGTFYIKEEN